MKHIILSAFLLITNCYFAQTTKNVTREEVSVIEYRDSTLTITSKDNSLLAKGNYKLITDGRTNLDFQINSSGQVEGSILAYREDGKLGRKTTIENQKMTMLVNYNPNEKMADSTTYSFENIEFYDGNSKKFVPKKCWIKHKFEFNGNGHDLEFETKHWGKKPIMSKTFYDDNKIESIKIVGKYENRYNENGALTEQTTYNWKTKEITELHYQDKKIRWSTIELNDKYRWEDGQVESVYVTETVQLVDGKLIQKANKNYKITSEYYPNGNIKSSDTVKNDEILTKEFSPAGKLIKKTKKKIETAPVMMGQ